MPLSRSRGYNERIRDRCGCAVSFPGNNFPLLSPGLNECVKIKLLIYQDLLGCQMPLQLPQSRDALFLLARCGLRRHWPSICPAFLDCLTLGPGQPIFLLTKALHQSLFPLLVSDLVLSSHFSHVLAKSSHLTTESPYPLPS